MTDYMVSPTERETLRRLAGRLAELAGRPREQEKRKLWYAHNALEKTRPLVFCDPENGWSEIVESDKLECTGEIARQWEFLLRVYVFWGEEMGDDRVIEPIFGVPYVYSESDWGMHETKIGGESGGSYTWESPLKSYDDFDKLRFPEIVIDHDAGHELLRLAKDTFGDILEVRRRTSWWWSLGMTWTLVNLRGMEQIMYDMADHPDDLHRLMAFLRDGHLAKLNFLEREGLLDMNNDGTYVGSGGFGWTTELPRADFDGRVRTTDMWGFCESQETLGVSPEMFAEFIFPYQMSILERFGLNCYGCCEPLDKRWNVVRNTPNLRRVSVSAWCDIADMAEKVGDSYIFSFKPNPSSVAVSAFDEDRVRRDLREALSITQNCVVEVILKDVQTIQHDPSRVTRWVRIAQEEAQRVRK